MNHKNELNYYLAYLQILSNQCKELNDKKPDLWSSYMPEPEKDWYRKEMLAWNCGGNVIAQKVMSATNNFNNYYRGSLNEQSSS